MNEFQTINVNLSNLSEEERKQLLELVKKGNKSPKKRWRAQKGESYYYMCGDGRIDSTKEGDAIFIFDERAYELGNYFKTKEEAEFELNRRLVYQELKDYALEHNEGEIDWKNSDQEKWVISYDNQVKYLVYLDRYALSDIGQIYFSSPKIAQEAVKTIGEDRIKKYLFGVK